MTDEEIIESCRRYSTRRELREMNPALLRRAYKAGVHVAAFAHMPKERHYLADGAKEKNCSSCRETKAVEDFYKSHGGRVRGECKKCANARSAAWAAENPCRAREIQRASEARYPHKVRERANAKRRAKPEVAAARDMLKRVLARTGAKKAGRTDAVLGYSANDLRDHIQRGFEPGMTWDNHGSWHIDHIKPVNVLIAEGETDPSVINALQNLRPLWALDNLRRSRSARSDYRQD